MLTSIEYQCSQCGELAPIPFETWIDSGTTITCLHCGKKTVFDLFTPESRAELYRKASAPLKLEKGDGGYWTVPGYKPAPSDDAAVERYTREAVQHPSSFAREMQYIGEVLPVMGRSSQHPWEIHPDDFCFHQAPGKPPGVIGYIHRKTDTCPLAKP